MTFLLGEIWLWLLPAFLIGVATGFLMARYSERAMATQAEEHADEAPPRPEAYPVPQAAPPSKPVRKVPPAAEPAARRPAGLHVIRPQEPDTPPATIPEPAPRPAAEPIAAPLPSPMAASDPSEVDDLTLLKGVGPKLRDLLNGLGVTSFQQIAAWSDLDVLTYDMKLGQFRGRIVRDRWVEQARLLAAGDRAAFEAQFGKSDGDA
ncbi:MAG: hypothetical protein E6R12_09410 [Sphingomonadales bacterium]|nr:MAG: hypothetical protein E6R12_09410 [Sphingomonadales bacterium]